MSFVHSAHFSCSLMLSCTSGASLALVLVLLVLGRFSLPAAMFSMCGVVRC
jgi:hypothetical protein